MIDNPWFYVAAVPAVLIAGISKGGFGGGLGVMAVPMMALAIAPVQAAAIMLPILCLMDFIGTWAYWRKWDGPNLRILIVAALFGVALGTATFRFVDADSTRLLIGVIAVGFTLNHWLRRNADTRPPTGRSWKKGGFWGAVAGFTSFVAHAGGPPVNVYLLPQKMDRTLYQSTAVIFFTAVNYMKLVPYTWLGQLDVGNLTTSGLLAPVAILGIGLGVWMHTRVSDTLFYRFCYGFLFLTGIKLLYDGISGLTA